MSTGTDRRSNTNKSLMQDLTLPSLTPGFYGAGPLPSALGNNVLPSKPSAATDDSTNPVGPTQSALIGRAYPMHEGHSSGHKMGRANSSAGNREEVYSPYHSSRKFPHPCHEESLAGGDRYHPIVQRESAGRSDGPIAVAGAVVAGSGLSVNSTNKRPFYDRHSISLEMAPGNLGGTKALDIASHVTVGPGGAARQSHFGQQQQQQQASVQGFENTGVTLRADGSVNVGTADATGYDSQAVDIVLRNGRGLQPFEFGQSGQQQQAPLPNSFTPVVPPPPPVDCLISLGAAGCIVSGVDPGGTVGQGVNNGPGGAIAAGPGSPSACLGDGVPMHSWRGGSASGGAGEGHDRNNRMLGRSVTAGPISGGGSPGGRNRMPNKSCYSGPRAADSGTGGPGDGSRTPYGGMMIRDPLTKSGTLPRHLVNHRESPSRPGYNRDPLNRAGSGGGTCLAPSSTPPSIGMMTPLKNSSHRGGQQQQRGHHTNHRQQQGSRTPYGETFSNPLQGTPYRRGGTGGPPMVTTHAGSGIALPQSHSHQIQGGVVPLSQPQPRLLHQLQQGQLQAAHRPVSSDLVDAPHKAAATAIGIPIICPPPPGGTPANSAAAAALAAVASSGGMGLSHTSQMIGASPGTASFRGTEKHAHNFGPAMMLQAAMAGLGGSTVCGASALKSSCMTAAAIGAGMATATAGITTDESVSRLPSSPIATAVTSTSHPSGSGSSNGFSRGPSMVGTGSLTPTSPFPPCKRDSSPMMSYNKFPSFPGKIMLDDWAQQQPVSPNPLTASKDTTIAVPGQASANGQLLRFRQRDPVEQPERGDMLNAACSGTPSSTMIRSSLAESVPAAEKEAACAIASAATMKGTTNVFGPDTINQHKSRRRLNQKQRRGRKKNRVEGSSEDEGAEETTGGYPCDGDSVNSLTSYSRSGPSDSGDRETRSRRNNEVSSKQLQQKSNRQSQPNQMTSKKVGVGSKIVYEDKEREYNNMSNDDGFSTARRGSPEAEEGHVPRDQHPHSEWNKKAGLSIQDKTSLAAVSSSYSGPVVSSIQPRSAQDSMISLLAPRSRDARKGSTGSTTDVVIPGACTHYSHRRRGSALLTISVREDDSLFKSLLGNAAAATESGAAGYQQPRNRWSYRAQSAVMGISPRSGRRRSCSILCIDLSDVKPAAAQAYPLAALVGRHLTCDNSQIYERQHGEKSPSAGAPVYGASAVATRATSSFTVTPSSTTGSSRQASPAASSTGANHFSKPNGSSTKQLSTAAALLPTKEAHVPAKRGSSLVPVPITLPQTVPAPTMVAGSTSLLMSMLPPALSACAIPSSSHSGSLAEITTTAIAGGIETLSTAVPTITNQAIGPLAGPNNQALSGPVGSGAMIWCSPSGSQPISQRNTDRQGEAPGDGSLSGRTPISVSMDNNNQQRLSPLSHWQQQQFGSQEDQKQSQQLMRHSSGNTNSYHGGNYSRQSGSGVYPLVEFQQQSPTHYSGRSRHQPLQQPQQQSPSSAVLLTPSAASQQMSTTNQQQPGGFMKLPNAAVMSGSPPVTAYGVGGPAVGSGEAWPGPAYPAMTSAEGLPAVILEDPYTGQRRGHHGGSDGVTNGSPVKETAHQLSLVGGATSIQQAIGGLGAVQEHPTGIFTDVPLKSNDRACGYPMEPSTGGMYCFQGFYGSPMDLMQQGFVPTSGGLYRLPPWSPMMIQGGQMCAVCYSQGVDVSTPSAGGIADHQSMPAMTVTGMMPMVNPAAYMLDPNFGAQQGFYFSPATVLPIGSNGGSLAGGVDPSQIVQFGGFGGQSPQPGATFGFPPAVYIPPLPASPEHGLSSQLHSAPAYLFDPNWMSGATATGYPPIVMATTPSTSFGTGRSGVTAGGGMLVSPTAAGGPLGGTSLTSTIAAAAPAIHSDVLPQPTAATSGSGSNGCGITTASAAAPIGIAMTCTKTDNNSIAT